MKEKSQLRAARQMIHQKFDLLVIFSDDQQAETALQDLRDADFSKEEAIILRGKMQIQALERLERSATIWGLIAAEVLVGAVLGTLIGWVTGLYLFSLTPYLVIGALLIGLGCGLVVGIAVGLIEWWRWSSRSRTSEHRILLGIRVGPGQLERLDTARKILESHGGLAVDSI